MVNVKFPFDTKYVDSMDGEALVINLTSQGGQISERQCIDISLMLLERENVKNVLVYNPERFDSRYLMEGFIKRLDLSVTKLEERVEYGV